MKTQKRLIRLISISILPCFLGACTGYNRVVLPKDQALPIQEKTVVLHRGEDTFYLTDVEITDEQLEGTAHCQPSHENRWARSSRFSGAKVQTGYLLRDRDLG